MNNWMRALLVVLALTIGSQLVSVFGYWTDRMDADLTLTIVHPVEISVRGLEADNIKSDIIGESLASGSNAEATE